VVANADRFQVLYDVERHVRATDGTVVEDPYPEFAVLRAQAPVHRGSVAELLGLPDRQRARYGEGPTYSLFSFEANDIALRDNEVFSSGHYVGLTTAMFGRSILEMGGEEHRTYRALVQPAFAPRRAQWWIDRWVQRLVDEAISAIQARGWAELNAELCARIPILTITSSFGLTREEALDFREDFELESLDREAIAGRVRRSTDVLKRVIEARRTDPQDDVITLLAETELDEDGVRHLLSDEEIYGFARLILTAGSGTTWRQLGNLIVGLLRNPGFLVAVREDRGLVRNAIEEALRWEGTDPIFRRLVTRDISLCGADIPAGAIVEVNLGAANRDPSRWEDPDRFDIYRSVKPHLSFASGPHICLGMHVARAEMSVALNALLDRLPDLRFAPDADPPRIIGLEHRGPNSIPVVFGGTVA
jgi:cytochrome P450